MSRAYRRSTGNGGSRVPLSEITSMVRKVKCADRIKGRWSEDARAVKGHEFGLDLSAEDRKALIAFLNTL